MRRHLIAGALACFGPSLFGQITDNPSNQVQSPLNTIQNSVQNTIQNSVQNGVQRAQGALDKNAQPNSGSSLNSQTQVNGNLETSGNAGVQGNTNLQNNLNGQSGQLNSNRSTQTQSQLSLQNQQSGNGAVQDPTNQYSNAYQTNGNNGFQSQSSQRQGQPWTQSSNSMQMGNGQQHASQQNFGQQNSGQQNSGRVYLLRFDASGREFICVDGRPVYFDNVNSVSSQANSATQNQYRAGYGNYDSQNGGNTPDASRGNRQQNDLQRNAGVGQDSTRDGNAPRADGTQQLRNGRGDFDSRNPGQAPANKTIETEKNRNNSDRQSDQDANTEAKQSSESSFDVPKA